MSGPLAAAQRRPAPPPLQRNPSARAAHRAGRLVLLRVGVPGPRCGPPAACKGAPLTAWLLPPPGLFPNALLDCL